MFSNRIVRNYTITKRNKKKLINKLSILITFRRKYKQSRESFSFVHNSKQEKVIFILKNYMQRIQKKKH